MGIKLDLLLRRTERQSSKLKGLLGLTVTRLAVLRNQRHVRCAQTRGDVAQLLQLGEQDRALLRVEQVIKEQNMLDVSVMIQGYCHLLTERAALLEHQKECPDELREAVSSLIFAASRCGDLPELQDVRRLFASKFGKDFAASAVDLRNNCGVNTQMILKLSTRQPSLESRVRVTKEIAAERGISIDIDEPSSATKEVDREVRQNKDRNQSQLMPDSTVDHRRDLPELDRDERRSESMKARQKYNDVASAAQAAFESAAYAAAAARAAVELSRSESQGKGPDDQSPPGSGRRLGSQQRNRDWDEHLAATSHVEEISPVQTTASARLEKSSSSSSSESIEVPPARPTRSGIKFDASDSEDETKLRPQRRHQRGLDEDFSGRRRVINLHPPYQKRSTMRSSHTSSQEAIDHMGSGSENEDTPTTANYIQGRSHTGSVYQHSEKKPSTQRSNIQRPVSMRTRRGF